MTKGRDNAAESLGDVLELVNLRRQNGLLSVERIQAGRFEEGEIYFQNGRPAYARTGQMAGQEALIWLLRWHQVYFTFLADEPPPLANISASVSVNNNVPVAANSVPSRYPQVNAGGPLPVMPSRQPQVGGNNPYHGTGTLNKVSAYTPFIPSTPSNAPANTPGLEWLTPRKIGQKRDVHSLPLTRPQRSIYFLVDGHRTVSDLARCTRKSIQEIERLLSELQDRGLVAV